MPRRRQEPAKRPRDADDGDAKNAVPFPEGSRVMMAILALLARKTAVTESTRELLTDCFSFAALDAAPTDASSASAGSKEGPPLPSATSLAEAYPEIHALRCVVDVRTALRRLQSCDVSARPTFFSTIATELEDLYEEVIPDPLFLALAKAIRGWLHSDTLPPKEATRLLEVQTLKVVDALQLEVLKQTKQLTRRATELTLRYRHQLPFCA